MTDERPAAVGAGESCAARWWRSMARGEVEPEGPAWILVGILTLASLLYGVVASVVLWLRGRRPTRFDVPVISVGNVVVGGAGKTPLVVHLARLLQGRGRSVAVVSRGYGREGRELVVVTRGDRPRIDWRRAGDEPYLTALLTREVAVVASARRAEGVRYAVEKLGADVILLDDAFQHVQVARSLDILVADAARPFGNGYLLPAGPLREPPAGIRRADLVVGTRCAGDAAELRGIVGTLAPGVPVVLTRMKPVELWDVATGDRIRLKELRGRPVVALSSIANPRDFERTLVRIGLDVVDHCVFPDHHGYGDDDLDGVASVAARAGAEVVLTTEKDAVRLDRWRNPPRLVALGIEVEIVEGEAVLDRAIESVVTGGK